MADLMEVLESRGTSPFRDRCFAHFEGPPCLSRPRPRLLSLALGTMHVWGVTWRRERVFHPALHSSGLEAAIPRSFIKPLLGTISLHPPNGL